MPDKRRDEEQLPPIPDGGLSESMPEWLRRPPAWRTLQDREVVQPDPVRTGDLPERDTSVIDPRTFLTDADLPEWIHALDQRPNSSDAAAVEAQSEIQDEDIAAPAATIAGPVAASRFVPRSPIVIPTTPADRTSSVSREAPRVQPPPAAKRAPAYRAAWWQGPQLVILLGVALLVALLIIVYLLV